MGFWGEGHKNFCPLTVYIHVYIAAIMREDRLLEFISLFILILDIKL